MKEHESDGSPKAEQKPPKLDVQELERRKASHHQRRKKKDFPYSLLIGGVLLVIGLLAPGIGLLEIVGIILLIVGGVRMFINRRETS